MDNDSCAECLQKEGIMYQDLLKEWIKTIPNKANRKYVRDIYELKVFAEWLDFNATQKNTRSDTLPCENFLNARDGACYHCGFEKDEHHT